MTNTGFPFHPVNFPENGFSLLYVEQSKEVLDDSARLLNFEDTTDLERHP